MKNKVIKTTKKDDASIYWVELPKVFFYNRYNRKEKKTEVWAFIPSNGHNLLCEKGRKYVIDKKSRKKKRYMIKESQVGNVYYLERIRVAKDDDGVKLTYVVVNARSKNNGPMQVVKRDFYGYSYKKESKKSYKWKVGTCHYGSMAKKTSFNAEGFSNITYAPKAAWKDVAPENAIIPEKVLRAIKKDLKLKGVTMDITPTDLPWMIKKPKMTKRDLNLEKGFYSILRNLEEENFKERSYWRLLEKLKTSERKFMSGQKMPTWKKERIEGICQLAKIIYLDEDFEISKDRLSGIRKTIEKIALSDNPRIDLIHIAILMLTNSKKKRELYESKLPTISSRIYYQTQKHDADILKNYRLSDVQRVMFSHEKYFNSRYYFGKGGC